MIPVKGYAACRIASGNLNWCRGRRIPYHVVQVIAYHFWNLMISEFTMNNRSLIQCHVFIIPLLAFAAACSAAPTAVPSGFTHVRTVQGITEYRLEANGLTVLLLPDHSAPAVTMM